MSQKYEKLKTLLKELFQLDQPDLDFGFYRIMHAKGAEVTQFLEQDLLPQVKAAFAQYQTADKAAIEKELAKAIEQARALGADPETLPKVKELREKLAEDAVDLEALEAEVYDHLYSFFRRYYSEGDFLSKRVYKPGVYAIPYEGEEVKLHWANTDQYYIKTSEYLRDYAFRLRPDDEENPMRVHFRLVDAAEGEHGNVKEQAGKERRFKLAPAPFAAVEDGELVIRFTYESDPERCKQKNLNADAEAAVLGLNDPALADWIKALGEKHVRTDGTVSENTRLRVHLDRYTTRNTFDYFIHKDLGGFLRRELDFCIKNEVMHLDDIESESAPRVEQYLSKIKVIRRIAGKIIDFLSQLEDFQKKLWLKKKFVVETSYCIRLGVIPEEFYPEIAANDAQREEWVRLCAIDEIKGDLTTPGYSVPLTVEFLKAHPTLVLDTRHFDAHFTLQLLEHSDTLDEQVDGLLIHSENFQALSLMQRRNSNSIQCIYIDPPFNLKHNADFLYRTDYKDSTWLSLLENRITISRSILRKDSFHFLRCDVNGDSLARQLCNLIFGAEYFEAELLVQRIRKNVTGQGKISLPLANDSIFVYANSIESSYANPYKKLTAKRESYWRRIDDSAGFRNPPERVIFGKVFLPYKRDAHFKFSQQTIDQMILEKRIRLLCKNCKYEHYEGSWERCPACGSEHCTPQYEVLESDEIVLDTNWLDIPGYSSNWDFPTENALPLLERVIDLAAFESSIVLDYFAGSGTTGHAVITRNREDGGRRRFILVEQGEHFDTVLLPRLKKVTYAPEWKDGKPKRLATPEEVERSPRIMKVIRLESYEDTLNNLELRRTKEQQDLLDHPEAQGADKLKEHYMLRYMLDVETRGSQSLLNVAAFMDPTAYKLKVKRPGSDESREVNVDLLETFNWLIGLKVEHIAAPRTFNAAFRRDEDPDLPEDAPRRLLLDGRLREDPNGPWWFRTVTGTKPDGRRTLIIWRKRPGGEDRKGIERDNLVLDEWFQKQGYSSKDSEFDLIYVNGDNNLENLKAPDDTWKVRLIEEDFFRLMFEKEGV
jgi:adenine-specific DNA-methyltransferase